MTSAYSQEDFVKLFSSLVEDVEDIHCFPRGTFTGSYEKIALSAKSRGIRVFLLDLPSLCNDLEQSLESGILSFGSGSLFVKRGRPTIFTELFNMIFADTLVLRSDVSAEAIRSLRQLFTVFKRFRIDPPNSSVKEKLDEFLQIEQSLPAPSLSWGDPYLRVLADWPCLTDMGRNASARGVGWEHVSGGDTRISEHPEILRALSCIQYVSDLAMRGLHWHPGKIRPKHGPGAVSEKFANSKFEFPTWPIRLELQFPFDEFGMVNKTFSSFDTPYDESSSHATVLAVPKDFKGPRLIASEPISSQFIQQGIMGFLRQYVRRTFLRHCIDFRSQIPSQELTLSASMDGGHSTIDLSSASDRLSCAVVECIFRRRFSFLEALNAARTPTLFHESFGCITAKKFAAQGAAFTFPIQTITYALICIGCIYSSSRMTRLSDIAKCVRVFGDDMIVPTEYFPLITKVLGILDLKTNLKKSFSKGLFRESCGMDAYAGVNVTPTKVLCFFDKRSPTSTVSTIEASNSLYKGGYIRASLVLQETIPWNIRKDIPFVGIGSNHLGFVGSGDNSQQRRWNRSLQRIELRALVVETRVRKSIPDGHSHLFQWFVEEPSAGSVWSAGEVTSVKARYRLRWVPEELLR